MFNNPNENNDLTNQVTRIISQHSHNTYICTHTRRTHAHTHTCTHAHMHTYKHHTRTPNTSITSLSSRGWACQAWVGVHRVHRVWEHQLWGEDLFLPFEAKGEGEGEGEGEGGVVVEVLQVVI